MKSLKRLDKHPKLLGFVWLNEFLGIYTFNQLPEICKSEVQEGLQAVIEQALALPEQQKQNCYFL